MSGLLETSLNNRPEEKAPPESPPSFLGRSSPRARWLAASLGILLLVAVASVWRYTSVRETTDDAQIDGHITPVSARVGGTVLEVEVNDNQSVEAGTVLVKIDPRDYQVAVDKAKADLAVAEAEAVAARTTVPITSTTTGSRLSSSQAGVENARAGIAAAQREVEAARAKEKSAQAELEAARATDTRASRDLERIKQLVAKDEVSQQEFDAVSATAQASHAAVEAAQANLAAATEGVAVAESHLIQSRDRLAEARAEARSAKTAPQQVAVIRANAQSAGAKALKAKAVLEQAELDLGYTVVKAPVAGWVSKKTVQIGQVVAAGQPLLAIVPREDIWVTANFKETKLKNMRPGQPVEISVDELGGRKFRGHVDSLAAATGERFSILPPENATGNYVKVVQRVPVKILFEPGQDPEHLLRPGLSVEPTVFTNTR